MAVYLLYSLSGSAALVCEVSWSRQVGLVVGNTAGAASLVLAAFFGGAAVGQLLGARLASRVRPLLGYGAAELAVAGWGCLVPVLLSSIGSAPVGDTAAAALCFAALLPATIALGATFPFVAEYLAQRQGGRQIALAYGLNTAGGLVGAVVATTFLLVNVGVVRSSYLAAGVSAACGLVACSLPRGVQPVTPPAPHAQGERVPGVWWLAAAVSGFGTLGLEVLYVRLFALVSHNSTYTFGAVVAVFIAGLAIGAALVTLGRRVPAPLRAAAGCATGSLAVAVSVVGFARLTGFEYAAAGESFAGYVAGVLALVAAVALPPSILLGMTLPALFAARVGGRDVGRLAAVNAAGAAAGAITAGFLLTPWLGLWGAFAFHVALFGTTGAALLLGAGRPTWAVGTLAAVAVGVVVVGLGPEQGGRQSAEEQVVRRWESPYGWIDVTRARRDGALRVRQNLHYRHGSTASAVREGRQGRLPLLLHSNPADVAFLGLGTGITAGAAVGDRDVRSVVVVELIPEVVEAARLLAAANLGVVDDPKVEVRVGDARHYLRRTDRRFDVITADLFVPWESRAGYLYTVEFYETVRQRLKPGGHFCQWLALYQFGPDEFELVADSFATVFPEVALWWGQFDGRFPILALVGSEGVIDLRDARMDARWGDLDAQGWGDPELARPEDVVALYLGQWPTRPQRTLNTDEHPRLEFAAPVSRGAGRSLSGPTLGAYFDGAFAGLPQGGVRFERPTEGDAVRRRDAQRLGLFGPSPP